MTDSFATNLAKKKQVARAKKNRFTDIRENPRVVDIHESEAVGYFGQWNARFFDSHRPITLELGCGRGEYTVALASKFPERSYLGVDIKGDRLWVGASRVAELKLSNAGFLRSPIARIPAVIAPNEIDEIWLTFPDPRPKEREEKHRLTNLFFLNMYRSLLRPKGWFRFKTDNTPLFNYTLEQLREMPIMELKYTFDLYASQLLVDHHGIKTKYENIWSTRGEKIKYMKFRFKA